MKAKYLSITKAFLILLSFLTVFSTDVTKTVKAISPCIEPGFSADYMGLCKYSSFGFWGVDSYTRKANMSWIIEKVSGKVAFIRQRVSSTTEPSALESLFLVDIESRRVLSIDGNEPKEETYTFFWIETDIQNGSLVKIENLTFMVEPGGLIDIAGASRASWALKASFHTDKVNGTIIRWYDKETGIQLMVKLNVTILIEGTPGFVETSVEPFRQTSQGVLEFSILNDIIPRSSYISSPIDGLISTFLALVLVIVGTCIHKRPRF